ELLAIRGVLHVERGERTLAVEHFTAARATCVKSGYVMALRIVEVLLGEVLLLRGRRREGLELLDEAEERSRREGMKSAAEMASPAGRAAPRTLALGSPPLAGAPQGRRAARSVSGAAYAALGEARAGAVDAARAMIGRMGDKLTHRDYAVERALVALAE